MDLNAAGPLGAFDLELALRVVGAAILGLVLGLDRELRGHAAGLRTHGLVCVSAAAMTLSIIDLQRSLDGFRMDPLRIYEATGTFVGIIGAGLIVFARVQLYNLTTAAHLWLTAAIGIACGAGQWPLVAIASIVSFVMLTLLYFLEPVGRKERKLGGHSKRDDQSNDEEEKGSS